MKVDALSSAEQTATPVISPTTRLQLTEGGSTAAGEASNLSDIASKWLADRSKKDSDNPTTTTTTTTTPSTVTPSSPVVEPEVPISDGVVAESDDLAYKEKATYTSYGVRNGGRQAWRINKKGPEFGQPIKIVFTNGQTFIVEDTSHNYRESIGDRKGFVFKPGIGPNGEGDDDTGTSHGGVYLHAPYGNSSKTATIYYNKP